MATDTNHRADFEAIGVPALADWLAIQTPHMDVELDKVLCSPYENIWAHTFRNIDEIAENANSESIKLKQGMKRIWRREDQWILDALSRPTEQRGKDPASAAAIAFPVAQQINEADGIFDTETISTIAKLFENNYKTDEKIYCIISPTAKKNLIDSSGGTIHSSDFVDGTRYFMNGDLPEIYGVHFIVHPLVSEYSATYPDAFFAYCSSAICYNQFDPLQTKLDEDPSKKFNIVLQIREYIGACRIDDLGVVQGTLGTP